MSWSVYPDENLTTLATPCCWYLYGNSALTPSERINGFVVKLFKDAGGTIESVYYYMPVSESTMNVETKYEIPSAFRKSERDSRRTWKGEAGFQEPRDERCGLYPYGFRRTPGLLFQCEPSLNTIQGSDPVGILLPDFFYLLLPYAISQKAAHDPLAHKKRIGQSSLGHVAQL
jgi:hypothetical protein